ncbi:LysR family transcriptional regulator [uncultured Roseobacter sp.]|uniref:LysR family transcriptional regulator n=1 Tax=uncultured Roseobacter sp. TaxID=114847 RepID=UPI002627E5D5|nr:LysR family transcriptional regulator [uncultured Roseobacter sp.]
MSLPALRSFIEACRCGSLSDAARNLGLTQPAVSQHIASLEAQLGRPLFDRKPRGVTPTAFAHTFAAQIGDGLDKAEAALAAAKARSGQLSGAVHIAGPSELMAARIAPHLAELQTAGLQIHLRPGGKSAIYQSLFDSNVDLAFTASSIDDPRLDCQKVGKEQLIAVASPQVAARIAQGASLAEGLQRASAAAYDTDMPLLRDWCALNRIDAGQILPEITAPDLRMLCSLIIAGAGWSVVPDYLCQAALDSKKLVEIPAPVGVPENTFYLVWVKSALRHPRVAHARLLLLQALGG